MGSRSLLCFVLLSLFCLSFAAADEVKLTVKSVTSIAKTDDNFLCATLDWWPENKCDYNQCPWGKAGILFLDLNNKILNNAIKAFNPLRIRVGGSLQDQVLYAVGSAVQKCPHFKKRDGQMFGFTSGCLHMKRWNRINHLFNETGAIVTFGVNALFGKKKPSNGDSRWTGDWNPQNTRDLMAYTINKGHKIESYELGNELSGSGVSARLDAEQYAKDITALKNLVKELYPNPNTRPKVLGPAGFYDETWYNTFLQATEPGVVDGVTHHIYNLGAGVDSTLINKVQDPYFLDQIAQTYKDASRTVDLFAPSSGAWVGEAGGAYNSGGKDVSHTFADGFWYLDQLGMTSTFNHKVFCRQALIGGNYALLNTTTFMPNPDYYGALLFHRLMGKNVLAVNHNGSPYLRAYSHCSKNWIFMQAADLKAPDQATSAFPTCSMMWCFHITSTCTGSRDDHLNGITVLLINMSNSTTFDVSIINDLNLYPGDQVMLDNNGGTSQREEYHLTPKDGNIQSDVVLLNGTPLELTATSDIPDMNPKIVDSSSPITVVPDSIVFVTLKGFKAPACAS